MNIVFIIPTGIGCEIGGHAGDANPAVKLIAKCCKNLITHPNAVNASDINEMPENTLYVEGSMLNRFLAGEIELKKVYQNKVLVVVNAPLKNETINAVSAARVTIGLDAEILVLNTSLRMIGRIENNRATGDVYGWKDLVEQVKKHNFDVLAIASEIEISRETKLNYFRTGGINPWGGVEAICSKLISRALDKPVAHSPTLDESPTDKELYFVAYNEILDPRMTPEVLSLTFLHCILKGLHKAPKIGKGLSVNNVDCLVTPYKCWGIPHELCYKNNIPIIAVKENETYLDVKPLQKVIEVDNYLEAAGIIMAMRAGIKVDSVRRPIKFTKVIGE